MKDFRQMVDTYVLDREKHKKYLAFVLALSMMVTFAVPLSLMQPAESMTANREFLGMPLAKANSVTSYIGNNTTDDVTLLIGENHPLRDGATTTEEVIANADREYALGIASQFCIFLDGDFHEWQADAEGRVAVKGDIIVDDVYHSYSIGKGDYNSRIPLELLIGSDGFAHIITTGEVKSGELDDTYFGKKDNAWKNFGANPANGDSNGTAAERKNKTMVLNYDALPDNYTFHQIKKDGNDVYCIPEDSPYTSYWQKVDRKQLYVTELFDFDEEFEKLENRNKKISDIAKANGIQITSANINGDTVTFNAGMTDEICDVVYFNVSADVWNSIKNCTKFNFEGIPKLEEKRQEVDIDRSKNPNEIRYQDWEYAYIIVNVETTGENMTLYAGDVQTRINGISVSTGLDGKVNNDIGVTSLLYNLYSESEYQMTLGKNFQGTIFSPNANVVDAGTGNPGNSDGSPTNDAGHLSGALIAKSFNGATEFGYRPYTGPISILGSTSGYTIPVDKFESDGLTPLPGAAFKLTITDQDDNVVTSWTSGDSTEYVTIPTMIDFTGGVTYTDAQDADPKNDLVQTRSYTVKEESAPEGYIGTEKTYTLTVEETINKDTLLPAEGGGTIPRDVEVTITITSDTGENLLLPTFTISDEYSEDAQTMRKITIDGKEFWLEIENQKVSAVGSPTGEQRLHEYEEDGTVTYLASTECTTTSTYYFTESETIITEIETESDDGMMTTSIETEVPKIGTETAINLIKDEWGNPLWIDGTTETTAVVVSSSVVTGVSVQEDDPFISTYITESSTTYTMTTSIAVTESQIPPEGITKRTEVKVGETRYYFDPNSLMFMPLPANNLEFVNEYGFLFKKVDEGGDPVTGATIVLEQQTNEPDTGSENGNIENDGYAVIKVITESSITIDPNLLTTDVLYRFRESVVPNGYEAADPIYFKKIDDVTILQRTSADGTGGTELKLDSTNDRTIEMEDQKIHGAKLKLYKSDADDANKLLTNTVFALYHESDENTAIKEGITIANGQDGFDFYEAFKNEPETTYIKNGYLVPGTYFLKETNVPDESGYDDNLNYKYYFTVKDDYSISVGKPDSIPIQIQGKSDQPTKVYYICDESGKPMNGEGNTGSIANVKSITFQVQEQTKTLSNLNELSDKIHAGSTSHKKEFSSAQNLTKLEFQTTDWSKDIHIDSVVIETFDGKKYVYNGSGGSGSGNTGSGDSGSGNTGSGDTGTDSEFKPLTVHAYNKNEYVICNPNGDKLEGNDSIKFEGIKSVQIQSNIQPRIYVQTTSNAVHDNNLNFDSNVDAYLYDFGSAVDVKTFKIMTTNWDTGINLTSVKITTSDGTVYAFGSASALTLSSLAETPKAEAAESAEESEKLEIREPVAENDRIILDIPNKYNSNFNLIATKIWDVKGNTSMIPSETEFALTLERRIEGGDWVTYDCTPTFEKTSDVEWTYRYKNLPVDDGNGNKYYYRIQEKNVPAGYDSPPTYSENVENGVCKDDTTLSMSVTNTLQTTSHKVTKTWYKQGVTVDLPDSIQVTLQQSSNGGTTWSDFKTVTITPDNGKWEYTFEDLPAEGMSYRAHEASLSGWEANHDWSNADSTAITNTYKTGGLRIKKEWAGDNEINRPDKITVKLYRKAVAGGGSGGNAGGTVSSLNIAKVPISTKKSTGTDVYTDYSRLLQYSLYFYDANMCGSTAPDHSAVSWRDEACHEEDAVQGGFHDAGDHVMFGLPQGYTASTLGWSYYEFKDAFTELGLTQHYKQIMDEFCNFFVASTTLTNGEVTNFLYQKGNGDTDHAYWGSPEEQANRSSEMYYTTNSASDIAAEYAAALAIHYLNFPNDANAQTYLTYAKALYKFSTDHNSCLGSNSAIYSTKENRYFYESINEEYKDDQVWAGVWLYLITKDSNYLTPYNNYLKNNPINWIHCWDNVSLGAACVYAEHIDSNHDWSKVTNYLNDINNTGRYNNGTLKDSNNNYNYWFLDQWGSARYNAAMQLAALVATTYSNEDQIDYSVWCKDQMTYLLGRNSANKCYVTGFADNSALYPHHRAASGYQNVSIDNYTTYDPTNGHVLVGALVGGPSNAAGSYTDSVKDYQCSEVALDYNAGLVGAAAGLYHFYKNDAAVNKTFSLVTDTTEIDTKGGIETAYPAVVPTAQSLILSPQQSEKANAIKGIAKVGSDVKAKGTLVKTIIDATAGTSYNLGENDYIEDVSYVEIVVDASNQSYNGRFIVNNYETQKNYNADSDNVVTVTFNSPVTVKYFTVFFDWNDAKATLKEVRFYTESSTPVFTITPSQSTITEGDTLNLTASGNTNTVQWSCDPSGAVTFNSATGNEVTITAQSVTEDTTVTITAKDGDGDDAPAATAEITIKPKDLNFSIDVTKVRVNGGAKTVTLTATPSDNVRFTYNDGVLIEGNTLTVNPKEAGELTITATRGGASTTQKIIFVGDPFIEDEDTMNVGDVKQLTLQNAIGTVTWALKEASDIVTISDTGEVTARKNGTVTVIATDSYDNKTAEFSITVDLFALDVDTSGMEEVDTLTLTKANDWTYTLQNLPITDEQGNAYVYYIEEVLDPATNTLTTPSAVYVPIDYAGNGIQLEENAGTKEMTVTNKLKSSVETTGQMPSAGGEGNGRYYMAGAAMMLAGIAGYFVLKRRQRSRADA